MAIKLSDLEKGQYKEVDKKKVSDVTVRDRVRGFATGLAKSVGETALGVGEIGRGIQRGISSGVSNVTGIQNFGLGNTSMFDPEEAARIREEKLKANAPGEGLGKFVGTTAQYLAPTGRITQGQQILGAAARNVPTKLGRGIAAAGARFVPEAIGTGAVAAVRSGGDLEQAKQEALLAGGASVGFGALGSMARATYWPLLDDSVSKALGIQGKKSGGAALRDTAQKTAGLQVLKDRAKNLTVTLDDGTKAAFDPNNATYNTTLQAWNQARKNIYNEYSSLTKKAGQSSTVNLKPVRENLAKSLEEPRLGVYKNAARSLIKDLDDNFGDLSKVDLVKAEKFLEDLNAQTVNGFFKGTSDAATSEINAGTARFIREQLDDVITEATGSEYQALRSQYAALKSIEDDLVRKFQQNARSVGGGLPEYVNMFSSGDIVGGLLAGQPAQVTRGGIIGALATLKRQLADPERFLKRSFNLIENEAPSKLSLRFFGGNRALSEGEERLAGDVVESVKNPNVGLSIKPTVTPVSVSKKLTNKELDLMADAIEDVRTARLNPDFNEMLDKYGLSKADDDVLVNFMKETTSEADIPGSTARQVDSFNQSATTKTTDLLEEARKYDSAEEFITNSRIVYSAPRGKHATNNAVKSTSYDPDIATEFSNATREGVEAFLVDEKARILDSRKLNVGETRIDMRSGIKYAKQNGYDAIDTSKDSRTFGQLGYEKGEQELTVLNKSILKKIKNFDDKYLDENWKNIEKETRTQLEDIWKQANE